MYVPPAGLDYNDNIPSVTFPAGSNQGAVVTTIVTIIPGPCVEEDEIFQVLLSTSDANAQIDPNQEIAVVTITDDSRTLPLCSRVNFNAFSHIKRRNNSKWIGFCHHEISDYQVEVISTS